MEIFPEIEKKIKYCIGLFCGYRVNFLSTYYWLDRLGVRYNMVKSIQYRAKSERYWSQGGGGLLVKQKGRDFFVSKRNFSVFDPIFLEKSCTICNDYTSESADISVGDTRLPTKKESLVIVRTKKGKKIINNCIKDNYLELKKIKPEIIIKLHLSSINYKKNSLKRFKFLTSNVCKKYSVKLSFSEFFRYYNYFLINKFINQFFQIKYIRKLFRKIPLIMWRVLSYIQVKLVEG